MEGEPTASGSSELKTSNFHMFYNEILNNKIKPYPPLINYKQNLI